MLENSMKKVPLRLEKEGLEKGPKNAIFGNVHRKCQMGKNEKCQKHVTPFGGIRLVGPFWGLWGVIFGFPPKVGEGEVLSRGQFLIQEVFPFLHFFVQEHSPIIPNSQNCFFFQLWPSQAQNLNFDKTVKRVRLFPKTCHPHAACASHWKNLKLC